MFCGNYILNKTYLSSLRPGNISISTTAKAVNISQDSQ